jgi:putative glycosyl hydrolase-like family 15 (GHL15) protein
LHLVGTMGYKPVILRVGGAMKTEDPNLKSVVSLLLAATLILGASRFPTAASRPFPDTSTRIAILTDQLPTTMSEAQMRFAATHYVGTQKLSLPLSRPIRKVNPAFLVLHYHLAMWQSAPGVSFIVDGNRWSNDFATVNAHESWFWHNPQGQRVRSKQDGKFLMNISDPGFRAYWRDSLIAQVRSGDYDGIFLDSASPALLQWEARVPEDPRLLGRGVRTNIFPELGGKTWIAAWQEWIADLNGALAVKGIPLIPNVGTLTTSWDNSDYSLTEGVFCEGFLDPKFATADWEAAIDQTLSLVARNKIVILQNYLRSADNRLSKRRYLLANYLLVKGTRTYLAYFASRLDWYPEWELDLGPAQKTAARASDLLWNGVYRRDFTNGVVLVNPATTPVSITLERPLKRLEPQGGGAVAPDGTVTGSLATTTVTTLTLEPTSAEILLR